MKGPDWLGAAIIAVTVGGYLVAATLWHPDARRRRALLRRHRRHLRALAAVQRG